MASAKTTTDHDEIRDWVESRGGSPARVRRTGRRAAGDPGILRIDFPGFSGEETLEHIDWDEWFDAFEKNNLAFLYQEKVAGGRESRFSKLVARRGGRASSATSARRGGAKRTGAKRQASAAKRSTGTTTKRAASKSRGTSTPRKGASKTRGKKTAASSPRARTKTKRAVSRRG